MKNQKNIYWILSGDLGTSDGSWSRFEGSKLSLSRNIKKMVIQKMWFRIYDSFYITKDGLCAGLDIVSGSPRTLPAEALTDCK